MLFVFETEYNQKTLAAMAKCIRKAVRKAKSKRSHIFGWIVIALALLLSFVVGDEGATITFNKIVTWGAALVIFITLVFEDKINGYFAKKRLLKGTEKAKSIFTADNFVSETAIGKSAFFYDKIVSIGETDDYFIFIFSISHAQAYDKNNLSGGTSNDFRKFISDVTGKEVIRIK